jgi:hypothetical protein
VPVRRSVKTLAAAAVGVLTAAVCGESSGGDSNAKVGGTTRAPTRTSGLLHQVRSAVRQRDRIEFGRGNDAFKRKYGFTRSSSGRSGIPPTTGQRPDI